MGRFVKNPILPGEDSIQIPVGTTAERPASPKKGMLRFIALKLAQRLFRITHCNKVDRFKFGNHLLPWTF